MAIKLTHQCDLSASAVSALISDGVVDFGSHSISSALNSAIFSTDTGSGADVWFSSDAAGAYPIAADIYYWDDSASEFKARVAAGALSAVSGGTIYLHVGSKPSGYDTDPYITTTEMAWSGLETVADRTSNSNNFTGGSGMTGREAGPGGLTDTATTATGASSYKVGPSLSGIVGGTASTDVTYSVWFKDAAHLNGHEILVEGGGETNNYNLTLHNGRVYATSVQGATPAYADAAYTAGQWNHAAITLTATGVSLYVNGVLSDTQADTITTAGSSTIGLGGASSTVDGVRLWDGTTSTAVGDFSFTGGLAMMKISSSTRTAAEINLDYLLEGSTASAYWTVTDITSQPSASFDLRSDREVVLSGSDVTSWGNATAFTNPAFSNDAADRGLGFPAIQFDSSNSEGLDWPEILSMFTGAAPDMTAAILFRSSGSAARSMFCVGGETPNQTHEITVTGVDQFGHTRTDSTTTQSNGYGSMVATDSELYLAILKVEDGVASSLLRQISDGTEVSDSDTMTVSITPTVGSIGMFRRFAAQRAQPYNGDLFRIRLYNTALGGDLTGDLTGTQLGDLKTLMLMTSGDSLGVAVGPAVGSAVRNIIRGF